MKRLILKLAIWTVSGAQAFAAQAIGWNDLKDPVAARFEDPFDALGIAELRSMATVYRLRQWLANGSVAAKDLQRTRERLDREEAKLAAAGVQTEALLSQRAAVSRRQVEAALKGNSDLSGKDVAIAGYVIPVLNEAGEARSGYLVPGFGMCSHVPAPPPNQMIRYRLPADWPAAELYKPVRLLGRLDLELSRHTINLLDGPVKMIAAFDMEVTDILPVVPEEGYAPRRDFRSFHGQKTE